MGGETGQHCLLGFAFRPRRLLGDYAEIMYQIDNFLASQSEYELANWMVHNSEMDVTKYGCPIVGVTYVIECTVRVLLTNDKGSG